MISMTPNAQALAECTGNDGVKLVLMSPSQQLFLPDAQPVPC